MSFFANLQKNIEEINTLKRTENGAIGYSTTGKKLLDMNFNVASYRKCSEYEIAADFEKAYNENELLAILWAFFVRDVRGGLGERRLFRVLFRYLIKINPDAASKLLRMIAEYGRWDDVVETTTGTELWGRAVELIAAQLQTDVENCKNGNSISLLAKWLPSERTSSQASRRMARTLAADLGMSIVKYNKTLVMLRKHLDIVESKMSAKQWNEIDYSAVPSKANLIYNDAFLRNDEERRRAYLAALVKGETKINASTLFPHDIVHKYSKTGWSSYRVAKYDAALESMWKALPASKGLGNVIVVCDGSGSMCTTVDSNSKVTALQVSNALAIYCSQYCKGEYKDKFITFSDHPQFVDLSGYDSLCDKLNESYRHNEMSGTDIEKVFNIILDTAIRSGADQSDLPESVLVVSDMEFNAPYCTSGRTPDAALFRVIEDKYAYNGYKMPRLVFWNVNSRTKTIPIVENENGVTLVSGFSTGIMQMVTNGQTDPYLNLVETITSKRYQPIIEALK